MKTITFAAEADVSDIFSYGSTREIISKFSNNCEKMYMYRPICSSENFLRKLDNSLRFRALHSIIFESYVF